MHLAHRPQRGGEHGGRLPGEPVEAELQDPGVLPGELDRPTEVVRDRLDRAGTTARASGRGRPDGGVRARASTGSRGVVSAPVHTGAFRAVVRRTLVVASGRGAPSGAARRWCLLGHELGEVHPHHLALVLGAPSSVFSSSFFRPPACLGSFTWAIAAPENTSIGRVQGLAAVGVLRAPGPAAARSPTRR